MKTQKIIYWISTILISGMMLLSSVLYLSKADILVKGFQEACLPLYLMPLLGFAKLSGSIFLVLPKWPAIKEWAYAGFTFTFSGAIWLHVSTATPFIGPCIALLLLAVSYVSYHKHKTK